MKSLDKGKVRLGKSTAKPFDTKGKIRNLDIGKNIIKWKQSKTNLNNRILSA